MFFEFTAVADALTRLRDRLFFSRLTALRAQFAELSARVEEIERRAAQIERRERLLGDPRSALPFLDTID